MVRIINYKEREKEDGTSFFVLEIQGGVEMVKSQSTNRFYVTAKRATIPSTFDEAVCQSLIGQELPGKVVKVETEPYEFTIKETGEVIELSHRYEYSPKDQEDTQAPIIERSASTVEDFMKFGNAPEHSSNGVM